MKEEMNYLQSNNTCELVTIPKGKKIINYKSIYKKKSLMYNSKAKHIYVRFQKSYGFSVGWNI